MSAELASLANVLDAAVVIIHDMDGVILHWTSGCERLYGYRRHEALGRRAHELLATRYPAPRSHIVATLAERGAWQGELEHRAKDGSTLSIMRAGTNNFAEVSGVFSIWRKLRANCSAKPRLMVEQV